MRPCGVTPRGAHRASRGAAAPTGKGGVQPGRELAAAAWEAGQSPNHKQRRFRAHARAAGRALALGPDVGIATLAFAKRATGVAPQIRGDLVERRILPFARASWPLFPTSRCGSVYRAPLAHIGSISFPNRRDACLGRPRPERIAPARAHGS